MATREHLINIILTQPRLTHHRQVFLQFSSLTSRVNFILQYNLSPAQTICVSSTSSTRSSSQSLQHRLSKTISMFLKEDLEQSQRYAWPLIVKDHQRSNHHQQGQSFTITWSNPSSGNVDIRLTQGNVVSPGSGIQLSMFERCIM